MLKQGTVKRSGNVTGIAIVQSVVYCVPCGVHALENKLVNRSVYKYNTGECFQVVFVSGRCFFQLNTEEVLCVSLNTEKVK